MVERRREVRGRTLRSGKIVFNNRQSVIDCLVRNLSETGGCLQTNTTASLPDDFELQIDGESRSCRVVWQTESRIGIQFIDNTIGQKPDLSADITRSSAVTTSGSTQTQPRSGQDMLRSDFLALRAALDLVPVGIVLLDADTRAQFINRAFRRMWRLPDAKADSKPPFVALMYHGRDTNAYALPHGDIDEYVAERVAHVKSHNPHPMDLRLASGEIIRLQCTALPSGGRMLCYTYVTDIVRHSDELEMLKGALDQMQQGIILLDAFLNAQFMNRAVRDLWKVSDEQADRKPAYVELVNDSRKTGAYGIPNKELSRYIADRIALIKAGDPTPMDIPHGDGRIIRSQCAVLPGGGRMLTYNDVTDLVRRADQFEHLACIDGVTGICNRRQFDALAFTEWQRFQRYQRPLSLLLIDIDLFKQVNDQLGHEAGDEALKRLAGLCADCKRTTDIVARIGGDEFAFLLPETDLRQAGVLAERLRRSIDQSTNEQDGGHVTVSIGIASAKFSMSGVEALLRAADKALYSAKAAGRNCVRTLRESHAQPQRMAAE